MDYKEKYEYGLECIQEILSGAGDSIKTSILRKRLQPFFPELKEPEDENKRISKEISRFLKQNNGWNHEWLTWLEKQGESKRYSWKPTKEQYEALDYAYNSCSDTERGNYYEGVLETLIEDLHRLEKQGKSGRSEQ